MAKIQENPTTNNPSGDSFFHRQIEGLGITADNGHWMATDPEAEFPAPKVVKVSFFEEAVNGDLVINYLDIEGNRIPAYTAAKNPKVQYYHQVRHQDPARPRYTSPKGMGAFPFFPPLLLEAFRENKSIDTLYITEGAKKAFAACSRGIPVVGLTSITTYSDKETGELHHDLVRLIEACHVQNLVILWDSDCRDIAEKPAEGEDLAKRPKVFYSAAKKIRELAKPTGVKVFFSHVHAPSLASPKGLDDLLLAAESAGWESAVIEEISPAAESSDFFYRLDITESTRELHRYFCLHDAEAFFALHEGRIGESRFRFHADWFQFDKEENKVKILCPGWAERIAFIGDEYFEMVDKPTAASVLEKGEIHTIKSLDKRSKSTLQLKYPGFEKYIKENLFHGFCCVPDHFSYQREIQGFYNRYHPLDHIPEPGDCEASIEFMKHIFGDQAFRRNGETYEMWELGLDYVQLLLTRPMQALPVLILFSEENNTGKSTFGKWLLHIFGSNAIPVGNSDLQSDFNEQYADKLLAICEETLLDRKRDVERLKALSTANKITVNPKGQRAYQLDFFCKFQFYSNNKRMIYVTKHDIRFWILKVPVPKEDNPHLLDRLKEETAAFLHFLQERELRAPEESRMWFHPDLYLTDIFTETVKINEPADVAHIRESVKELFAVLDGQDEIIMTPKAINQEFFNGRLKRGWLREIIQDYLRLEPANDGKTTRSQYPRLKEIPKADENDQLIYQYEIEFVKENGRAFSFFREDFDPDF